MLNLSASLHEDFVNSRYSHAARVREPALCRATTFDERLLAALPKEVVERDYGCADPSCYLQSGETILDLGSGTGKVCFVAAQVVGKTGRVIGVDVNDDMLKIARRAAAVVADRIGYANVEFRKGRIQDLELDLESFVAEQAGDIELTSFEQHALAAGLRGDEPMVATASIDVVVSNCVVNLLGAEDKSALFGEIYRVLKPGGRAILSDIVSSQDVPQRMQDDPDLWSACVSGATREDRFVRAFVDAGLRDATVLDRHQEAWRVVEGIEFRGVTVAAYKDAVDAVGRA